MCEKITLVTTNRNNETFNEFNSFLLSKQLRRLRGKKQVFSLIKPEIDVKYDYVHDRLTHSLEVLSLSREIIKMICDEPFIIANGKNTFAFQINYSDSLLQSIALAHDFGHTPFGHVGETALSDFLCRKNMEIVNRKAKINGIVNAMFKHNYYSAILLARERNNCPAEIIDGVLKHSNILCFNGEKIDNVAMTFGAHIYLPKQLKNSKEYFEKEFAFSLEGQVVAVADEIAQILSDIEDSNIVFGEVFSKADVNDASNIFYKNPQKTIKSYLAKIHRFFVDSIVRTSKCLVLDYLNTNCSEILTLNDRCIVFRKKVIDLDEEGQKALNAAKKARKHYLHFNEKIKLQNCISYLIIYKIFDFLISNPSKLFEINKKSLLPIINGFVDIRNKSKIKKYNKFNSFVCYIRNERKDVVESLEKINLQNGKMSAIESNKKELENIFRYLSYYYFNEYGSDSVLDSLSNCYFREVAFAIAKMTDKYSFNVLTKIFKKGNKTTNLKRFVKEACKVEFSTPQFCMKKSYYKLIVKRLKDVSKNY